MNDACRYSEFVPDGLHGRAYLRLINSLHALYFGRSKTPTDVWFSTARDSIIAKDCQHMWSCLFESHAHGMMNIFPTRAVFKICYVVVFLVTVAMIYEQVLRSRANKNLCNQTVDSSPASDALAIKPHRGVTASVIDFDHFLHRKNIAIFIDEIASLAPWNGDIVCNVYGHGTNIS